MRLLDTCTVQYTTGWKLSYVRKLLKQLKLEGLITSDLYVDTDHDLDRPALIRGYTLTTAGMNTQAYRLAYEQEREACKQCFGFDIGPTKYNVEEAFNENY